MSHDELCRRAEVWLRNHRRCKPVLSKVGSCREIPDGIGWSSHHKWRGSTVVECKTSRSDFLADAKKYFLYQHPQYDDWTYPMSRISKREAKAAGYRTIAMESMGDFRFFLSRPDVVTAEMLTSRPDHGLLHLLDGRVKLIVDAPRREKVDRASEVHYLRFALIHLADNLQKHGCAVNLTEATKFFGSKGIELPSRAGELEGRKG